MAKFITGRELDDKICDIIWHAQETLIILSPFIKLDDYFKKLFAKHINNPKLHLIVVFGKNEGEVKKSLSKSDFDFFKEFPMISIVFVPHLHAKYYGNEKSGVITSINLYDSSFKNNIEFGVYSEHTLFSQIIQTTTVDNEAWNTAHQIAEENEAVFIKRPVYEKKLLSTLFGKNYVKSDILLDATDKFYLGRYTKQQNFKKIGDFLMEIELGSSISQRPTREQVQTEVSGYCIRTGVKITFNPKRPFSENAYKSWAQFNNPDYPEKFCHKTGKPSHGKTTMRNPML